MDFELDVSSDGDILALAERLNEQPGGTPKTIDARDVLVHDELAADTGE